MLRSSMKSLVTLSFLIVPEVGSGQQFFIYQGHATEVTSVAFSPDGKSVYSTALKEDRVWSAETGATSGYVTNLRSHSISLSPDGKHAAIAGFQSTSIYDLSNNTLITAIAASPVRYHPPFMSALDYSPDGKQIAAVGSSREIRAPHGLPVAIVTLHDSNNGEILRNLEGLSIPAEIIAFSPDGKLLAAGSEGAGGELPETGELVVWNTSTGEVKHRLKHVAKVEPGQNRCSVSGIAFHPSGEEVAIASSDGTVRVWNLNTESIRLTCTEHEKPVRRVAYTPDGKRLASAGLDQTVKVWNAEDGALLNSLPIDCKKVNAVVFSPDGRRLAAGGGDFLNSGTIVLWKMSDE